jgi:hypothetical protein
VVVEREADGVVVLSTGEGRLFQRRSVKIRASIAAYAILPRLGEVHDVSSNLEARLRKFVGHLGAKRITRWSALRVLY